ncbi:hypothetical protein [Neptunomonas antarctica]|uniref:Uncharacterized protein n=1 Tax=Neptunomonas antarctica TaxID=619304 RepID=A0A1N7KDX7_9GAMM|nr:hypothetical protein [Neptunomonas antarctica]SIS59781.1 hypothetical protein SAMN05421760_102364 [Neptunomonas antarctica]
MLSNQTYQLLKIVAGIFAFSAVLLVLWKLPQILDKEETPHTFSVIEPCDLKQAACTATQGNKSITLEARPKNIVSLMPINFTVKLKNIEAHTVVLDITGKDMYMGINQIKLTPRTDDSYSKETVSDGTDTKETVWEGTTELAICTTGSMLWQAAVLTYPDPTSKSQIATFEFESR